MRIPFTYPADYLKERDFGQKIEASFDFIRGHFRPLGRALLYIVLPLTLVQGIAQGLMMTKMTGLFGKAMQNSRVVRRGGEVDSHLNLEMVGFLSSPEYVLALLTGLVVFTLLVLTVYGYLVLRLEKATPEEEVTVPEVWALVRRRFLGTMLSFFGLGLVFGAGTGACVAALALLTTFLGQTAGIILGIFLVYGVLFYMAVAFSLFFIIWLRERRGFFASLRRCFTLIWGKWWSTFGLIMVMGIIVGMLAMVVFGLTTLISSPFAALSAAGAEPSRLLAVVAGCLNSTALLALYPLLLLAIAFQYFNLVERKEGESLAGLVAQLGSSAPQTPAATPLRPDDEGEY